MNRCRHLNGINGVAIPIYLLCALLMAGQGFSHAQPVIQLTPVATNIPKPVAITSAADGSGRLFIALQGGSILIYNGRQILPAPFLDIGALVSISGERGLLGLAFHPHFAVNGLFYIDYTDLAGDTVIARYTVSADPDAADPTSAAIILSVSQPFANHNGGQLQFGPDGYLYIGMGDGGSGGDPMNNAQSLSGLLGKILRLDVDTAVPYAIPADNPFRGTPGAAPEIWALGLRNPWRFSFDRQSGDFFIADVGQDDIEEIDFQAAASGGGENYGWRLMEGGNCFDPPTNCNDGSLTIPILAYSHLLGCAVIGGFRYRGPLNAGMQGIYFYGDFCSGRIWGAAQDAQGTWHADELLDTALQITAFGEDETGELYVASFLPAPGAVYSISEAPPPSTSPGAASSGGGGGCMISWMIEQIPILQHQERGR